MVYKFNYHFFFFNINNKSCALVPSPKRGENTCLSQKRYFLLYCERQKLNTQQSNRNLKKKRRKSSANEVIIWLVYFITDMPQKGLIKLLFLKIFPDPPSRASLLRRSHSALAFGLWPSLWAAGPLLPNGGGSWPLFLTSWEHPWHCQ